MSTYSTQEIHDALREAVVKQLKTAEFTAARELFRIKCGIAVDAEPAKSELNAKWAEAQEELATAIQIVLEDF